MSMRPKNPVIAGGLADRLQKGSGCRVLVCRKGTRYEQVS